MIKVTRMVSENDGTILRNEYDVNVNEAVHEALAIHAGKFEKIWYKVSGIDRVSYVVAWSHRPNGVTIFDFSIPEALIDVFDTKLKQARNTPSS